ncbi:MucBP domain-containing protein [Lactiplantibacillus songbeiensis]|uniref:MucBP domain-containing protein n=1 Tax=Lactiplantibacillus songbeiensis TaxID=2559920 RepID=A0ABW4C094_9LACO|nr:MucBP domain-containing protein [Lactiplantibacillus songbeiensis]
MSKKTHHNRQLMRMYKPGKLLMMVLLFLTSWGLMTVKAQAQPTLESRLAQPTLSAKAPTTADAAAIKQLYTELMTRLKTNRHLKPLKLKPQKTPQVRTAFAGLEFMVTEVQKNGIIYPHNFYWPQYTWLPLNQAIDHDFWESISINDEPLFDEELVDHFATYLQDVDLVKTTYGNKTYGEFIYQSYLDNVSDPDDLDPDVIATGIPTSSGFQAWILGRFARLELGQTTAADIQAEYAAKYREYVVILDEFVNMISGESGTLSQFDTMISILDSDIAHDYFIKPMLDNAYAIIGADYPLTELATLDPEATIAINTTQYHAPALDRMITQHQGQTWLTLAAFNLVQTYIMDNPADIAAPVTVSYEDQAGQSIADSRTITGNLDDAYDTTTDDYQLAIAGYTLDKTKLPVNAKGTLTADQQTVTYVYTKDVVAAKPVTVHYQDETGTALAEPDVLTGNVGDPYATTAKSFKGYTLANVTGPVSGTLSETAQTVVYTYAKDPIAGAPVTVRHQDEAGQKLAADETLKGNIGDQLQTKAQSIDGYVFKSVDGEPIVTITDQPQTVIYTYTPIAVATGSVTINYLDADGQAIAPATTLTGAVGDSFESAPLTITGYTLKPDTTTISGRYTQAVQQFSYHYTKTTAPVTDGAVLVRYVDQDNHQLADATTLTGRLGEAFTTTAKTIPNYELVKTEGPIKGTYTETLQTVTYRYKPVTAPVTTGQVNVHYVDTGGNTIAESATLTGNVGTTYQTTLKEIAGYTYQKVTGAPSGQYTSATQTVTYVYTKSMVAVDQGKVTVNYTDLNGKPLQAVTILAGEVGTAYTTTAAKITGYTFHDVVGTAEGTFTTTAQTVTYRYQAVKTTAPIDPDDGGSSDSDGDTINPGPSTKPTTSTGTVATSTTPMKSTATQILKVPASSGRLPKSNEQRSSWLTVIGLGLLAGIGLVVWRMRRHS